jgi:betaine-aldehyde dehydrogenase
VSARDAQPVFIAGRWCEARSAEFRTILNPATLKALDTVAECGAADVDAAVRAAGAAAAGWGRLPGSERATLLREAALSVRAQGEALAAVLMRESGMPRPEARDSVEWTAACFDAPGVGPGPAASGPMAVTVPACFPLLQLARRIAPALAAGTPVICRAPVRNPLAYLLLARCLEILPPGVFNLITGGDATWNLLAQHPGVAQVAARPSPSIESILIAPAADLELAAAGVAWARLRHSGQNGNAIQRVFVENAVAGEFATLLHEYVAFLEVADPVRPDTDLGPLVSLEAVSRLEQQVGHALQEGARLLVGGRRFQPWGLHFFQPTVLTDVRPDSVAAAALLQGPVVAIIPVVDAREAQRLAAGSAVHPPFDARRSWWFPYRERGQAFAPPP